MRTFCFFAGIALFFAATNLQAVPFNVTYDFANVTTVSGTTDPTPVPTATGVAFGSFTSTGLSANPNAAVRFSFTSDPIGGVNADDNFADFTGSIDLTKFFSVTLTPMNGFTLNIDTISFTIQRSGTGIRNFAVRGSANGFGANLSASINPANSILGVDGSNDFQWLSDANTSAQNGSLITLGSTYDALTSATTFRFYGWNAEQSGGTFSIDNVNFAGSVTESVSAPEQSSSFALALLGLSACFAFGRKAVRLS